MVGLSDEAVRAWTGLVSAHKRALGIVEAALKRAGHPPLEWYDVLWELERGGPVRPRDLQARLLLAQSNLSRLLDRMERAGLVETGPCDDDRRGQLVSASADGLALRRRMWPDYAGAIATVTRGLSAMEAQALADLLGRVGGEG